MEGRLTIRAERSIVRTLHKNLHVSGPVLQSEVEFSTRKNLNIDIIRWVLHSAELNGHISRKKPWLSRVNQKKRLSLQRASHPNFVNLFYLLMSANFVWFLWQVNKELLFHSTKSITALSTISSNLNQLTRNYGGLQYISIIIIEPVEKSGFGHLRQEKILYLVRNKFALTGDYWLYRS